MGEVFGLALACIVTAVIFASIAFNGSALLSPPILALAVALGEVVCLAWLEGLEIGLSALRYFEGSTDPRESGLRKVSEIAADSDQRRHFLAGRQLLVVFLVVTTAILLTPERTKTIELLSWNVPSQLSLLLSIGLLQALFLAWFAQVLPKIVAVELPLVYLKVPGTLGVVRACAAIGASPIFACSRRLSLVLSTRLQASQRYVSSCIVPYAGDECSPWGDAGICSPAAEGV